MSGQSLVEAGESYRQLAEVKYSMEDNVKQNFLDPLAHIQNKDLKEVNVCSALSVYVVLYLCLLRCWQVNALSASHLLWSW